MNGLYLIGIIFEIWAIMFLVWGAFNESKLIKFERKIIHILRLGKRGK